jgi:molybdopterin synthase catalytic subunit
MTDAIALLAIRDTPLDIHEAYAAVQHPGAGGVTLFVGTVRDHDGGKSVDHLGYSSHPTAEAALRRVAVACVHRGGAFEAARHLIDELKATVPIWKHQSFGDGSDEWVGTPQ